MFSPTEKKQCSVLFVRGAEREKKTITWDTLFLKSRAFAATRQVTLFSDTGMPYHDSRVGV